MTASLMPQWLFLVLGPAFLLAALVSFVTSRRLGPKVRSWLILGASFSVVAAWLWWTRGPIA